MTTQKSLVEIGNIRFYCDDLGEEVTIVEWLRKLLSTIWIEQDQFSGKRPFGNSSWSWDPVPALHQAGIVNCKVDEDGFIESFPLEEEEKYFKLILKMIRGLVISDDVTN